MKTRSKVIRILAFVLVASFLVLSFAGCFSSKKDDDAAEDDVGEGSSAYKQYMGWLKQYEQWVDSYIKVCQNYEKNPTAYMSAYLTETAKLTEWSAKFSNIDGAGMTSAEAAKISAEYLRIYNKLMKAVSEIN